MVAESRIARTSMPRLMFQLLTSFGERFAVVEVYTDEADTEAALSESLYPIAFYLPILSALLYLLPALGLFYKARQARRHEADMYRLSHFDNLTGVLNRHSFTEEYEQHFHGPRSDGLGAGILFVDLDNFKAVNDQNGHDMGDAILCHVADTLKNNVGDKGCGRPFRW